MFYYRKKRNSTNFLTTKYLVNTESRDWDSAELVVVCLKCKMKLKTAFVLSLSVDYFRFN